MGEPIAPAAPFRILGGRGGGASIIIPWASIIIFSVRQEEEKRLAEKLQKPLQKQSKNVLRRTKLHDKPTRGAWLRDAPKKTSQRRRRGGRRKSAGQKKMQKQRKESRAGAF